MVAFIASESGEVEQVFSRSLERILILFVLWYKATNLTAEWPPLLILSGASRPGNWTPFDSISFA